jgi:hypothetical protein
MHLLHASSGFSAPRKEGSKIFGPSRNRSSGTTIAHLVNGSHEIMNRYSAQPSASPAEALAFDPSSPAESFYQHLDGRVFCESNGNWRTRVFGVMMDGDDVWVQLTVTGPVTHSVLLRADRLAVPEDAIRSLEFWLCHPQVQRDRIIDVSKIPST